MIHWCIVECVHTNEGTFWMAAPAPLILPSLPSPTHARRGRLQRTTLGLRRRKWSMVSCLSRPLLCWVFHLLCCKDLALHLLNIKVQGAWTFQNQALHEHYTPGVNSKLCHPLSVSVHRTRCLSQSSKCQLGFGSPAKFCLIPWGAPLSPTLAYSALVH